MKSERSRDESAETRTAILKATEKLMCEEGYAAVSSRKVAQAAGLKSQLVYYHFGTMDELFLSLYRLKEEAFFVAHAKALASRNPLTALWKLNAQSADTELSLEFIALANHRKVIRAEILRSTERYRNLQIALFKRVLEDRGVSESDMPPELLSFLLIALSRGLVTESVVGVEVGHQTVRAYVERWLKELESRPLK